MPLAAALHGRGGSFDCTAQRMHWLVETLADYLCRNTISEAERYARNGLEPCDMGCVGGGRCWTG